MKANTRAKMIAGILALSGGLAVSSGVLAEPTLQLYLQGATYDTSTETWVLTSTDPLKLWVLGFDGPIYDVKLAIAYSSALSPGFALTSTTTGGYLNYTDPSTPVDAQQTGTGAVTAPLTGDGSPLPSHGIYGAGTSWTEFLLGDFTLTDSPVCDFTAPNGSTAPDGSTCTKTGQINVYEVSITGVPEGSAFHFDAYDHIVQTTGHGDKNQYVFAPFSHDGEGTSSSGNPSTSSGPIPEPGTLSLLGVAILGGLFHQRRRRLSLS